MFLNGQLNHRCYKIDTSNKEYQCMEMPMITSIDSVTTSTTSSMNDNDVEQ